MFNQQIIAKLQKYSTPFYYYDLERLRENLALLKNAASSHGYHVHYALKANADERVLRLVSSSGLGADCVSGNEIKRALETGFPAAKIVFAGVGKTDDEIRFAIENDIYCLNCESIQELEVVNNIAGQAGKTARVALRINPNLDAKTHRYITTGLEENKFGIYFSKIGEALNVLQKLKNLKFTGLHFHIGSQISDLGVFKNLCLKVNEIHRWFREKNLQLTLLNLGGGLGVDYEHPDRMPDFQNYFRIFHEYLKIPAHLQIHFELGRSIVAQAGALISRVLYIKQGISTQFVVVDAGMTELIRPALYHASHRIENLSSTKPGQTYDVVGPVCESADYFGKGVELPETQRGDLIAIRSAGAYARVMASQYNLRNLAKVVYSDEI